MSDFSSIYKNLSKVILEANILNNINNKGTEYYFGVEDIINVCKKYKVGGSDLKKLDSDFNDKDTRAKDVAKEMVDFVEKHYEKIGQAISKETNKNAEVYSDVFDDDAKENMYIIVDIT